MLHIINKTAAIDKFRVEMVAQVERGEFEHLLLADADAGLERWACVSCKHDNAKNLTVREKGDTQTDKRMLAEPRGKKGSVNERRRVTGPAERSAARTSALCC